MFSIKLRPFILHATHLALASIICFTSNAQTLNGLATGNYAGIAGLNFNPASIVDSRYKFDLNIASAQVFFTNNFLDANPFLFGARKLFKPPYNGSFESVKKDLIQIREPMGSDKVFVRQNSEFQLPLSFMLTTGRRSAIAINLRNRTEIAVDNLNPQTAKLLFNELSDPQINGVTMNNDGLGVKFMNWQEVGFTYGRVIFNARRHFFKAAVTGKMLAGNAAAYLQADKMSLSFANATTISMQSPQVNYGRTERADFDLFSRRDLFKDVQDLRAGFDAGVVYEFRGRFNKYKYTDEDEQTQFRRDANKYTLRLGATINDVGFLQYKRLPLTQNYSANINNWDFSTVKANNIREWDTAFAKQVNFLSNTPADFSVQLPTALILNADLHLFGGFYVNAAMQRRLPGLGKTSTTQIVTGEWYAVTPRFEGRFFGLYVPIIIRNEVTQVGATVRFGPLFVGSNNLLALAQNSKVPTADLHAGFRIPIGFGKPSKLSKAFEKSTGVKVTDDYGSSIDSNKTRISMLEFRLAYLEKMADSAYRKPPTVIINNYVVDSAGTKRIYNEVQQQPASAKTKTQTSSNTAKPRTTSTGMPEPYTQKQVDSIKREYEKMKRDAKRSLENRGINEPKARNAKSSKEEKTTASTAKSEKSIAKQAKKDNNRAKKAAKSNERYNKAVEQELRRMRRQQAVANTAMVGAVTAGVVVDANNSKTDSVVIRDTVFVEKIIRDTIIIHEPETTSGITATAVVNRKDTAVLPQPNKPTLQPSTTDIPELRTARVFFASGKATIGKQYQTSLNKAAGWMLKNPNRRALLTGVTDATGSPAANKKLAQQRVDAVKAAMVMRGIDASRFETEIKISDSKTQKNNSANRRVDMSVIQ